MQAQKLEVAIDSIRVRFGSQALTRAAELPPPQPWLSGTAVDHLTGIGGLPRGRLALFTGSGTSGKLSLGLSLLAGATREFAHAMVIDGGGFDPWTLTSFSPELGALTVVRAPAPEIAGEAAATLSRAGAGFLLLLCEIPCHWLVAASEETSAFGVLHGMALRQAEHLCPQATFVLPDEEAVVRIRELIAAALYDLAPVVEVRDEGIAWLDLSGVTNPGQSIRAARH